MLVDFIRHGMTPANETTGISGRRFDWPLSENGRRQIQALAERGIYPREHGSCYTSTLIRTQQTLELIYPGAPFEATHLLDERDLGEIEYVTDPETAYYWRTHLADENGVENPDAYRGGEDFQQFSQRVTRDFNTLLETAWQRGQELITVCGHGSYLRQIGICFQVPSYINIRPIVKNGQGFVFQADRLGERAFSLRITGFIGGSSLEEVLTKPYGPYIPPEQRNAGR